ncbi:hypothetical protein ANN_07282 [Periplaneta americana]|uniref:Uncharacterized protein n=1 Tax=Periplaneta americana TaxID=6978 RepID=A0ABQ8THW1_PERAM|nr:hypothetical protein ANN_07282 [Periplaneta americana]
MGPFSPYTSICDDCTSRSTIDGLSDIRESDADRIRNKICIRHALSTGGEGHLRCIIECVTGNSLYGAAEITLASPTVSLNSRFFDSRLDDIITITIIIIIIIIIIINNSHGEEWTSRATVHELRVSLRFRSEPLGSLKAIRYRDSTQGHHHDTFCSQHAFGTGGEGQLCNTKECVIGYSLIGVVELLFTSPNLLE